MSTRKHRFRRFFVFVSALAIFATASFVSSSNNIMKAETIIDDGPSGDKIVDIATMGDTYFAINEKGEVYSWSRGTANSLLGWGENPAEITNARIPKKVINFKGATDGQKYLSDVSKVFVSINGAIALKKDGSMYSWGVTVVKNLVLDGVGADNSCDASYYCVSYSPQKVNFDIPVKDIVFRNPSNAYGTVTSVLTTAGEVYSMGVDYYGSAGLGIADKVITSLTKMTTDNKGNTLPEIKAIEATNYGTVLLTNDGRILECGTYMTVGGPTVIVFPTQALYEDGTEVNNIEEFAMRGGPYQALVRDMNGNVYRGGRDYKADSYTPIINEATVLNNQFDAFPDFDSFEARYVAKNTFVKNSRAYILSEYGRTGFNKDTYTVNRYIAGEITEDYANVKKMDNNLLLSNDGGVFLDGVKVTFGDIALKATKSDSTPYNSMEKYNDNVTLTISPTDGIISNVRYYETDLTTGVKSAAQVSPSSMNFIAEEGKRIYKKYDFFIEGKEADTTTSFTVDLYKNPLDVSGIKNNGKYTQGSSFALGYNGFAENSITGKLTKSNGSTVEYTSGTAIDEVGNYTLAVVDQYGNANSYTFDIVTTKPAESITFTKSTSGNLVYDDSITKPNNIVGNLSLVYPTGQDTSTIKTLTIESGHDGANFEVVNINELKVIGTQLEAREYTISVSGTDQNDMPFSGDVTFTVDKAAQTMTWDDASSVYGTNGLSFGDTATLGIKDLLGSATVSYSLKTPNACVTINTNQVSVTCIPNPASVVFVATPSVDSNYDNKPIELPVTISKKAINLDVELQDASTYKNDVTIKVGDALPTNQITCSDSSIDVSSLGTVTYVYKKNGATVVNPSVAEGVYSVNASYPSGSNADNYTITWQPATLRVEGVSIDEGDYVDYFTITTGGNPYTIGSWTKDPIIITPIHSKFSRLDVNDAGAPSTNAYNYEIEGDNTVKLTFSTVDGASVSVNVNLKYDKTKPVMQNNIYEDADSALRSILRALTFDNYFSKAQNVSFQASDSGSGLDFFTYEITELDASGNEIPSTIHSGTASTTDKIALSLNKNYKIKVQAEDMVGNISDEAIETVYISDAVAQLSVDAKHNGVAYDGTTWVNSAVDFKLTSNSSSGVEKYQYAMDGVTFVDFTSSDGTISLPNPLANQKNVTYTFRAINNDGTTCDKTFKIKLDKEKPTIQVKGTVEGASYDGGVVDKDVSIVPYQSVGNISGITYYYTTDASSKDSDPLTDSNWKAYGTELKQTTNGTTMYYFKGVSGAKLVSDTVEYRVQIANKAITLDVELNDKGSYSKDVSIKVGDTLPIMRVTSADAGVDISAFGTPTFTYTKNGINVDNPSIEEGIYVVSASYPGNATASSYNITFATAILRVNGIVLEEGDYHNYFTMTSGGTTYTQDTWTKDPIIITPIHEDFNRLDVDDAGSPSTIAYTYQVEGNHNVKLSFYTPEGAKVSVTLPLKYDKTKPVMQANTYVDADSNVRSILRSITFNKYFNKAQKVSFHAKDSGSGVAFFQYEIIELDSNGVEVPESKLTGTATLTEQITLSINKNYKVKAKAVDIVGNIGDEQSETVSLSDQVAQLIVSAKNKGVAYDGTTWVNSAIDFSLKSSSASGVEKYQYADDGTTFTDFTSSDGTITLPSPVVNQNNLTYTFRAINNDGSSCDTTYQVKVDATKPIIEVKGSVNGSDYAGSEVDQDVRIVANQTNTNISGITYYYTTVESAKDADPTTNANWKTYSGSILHTLNGTITYYFKGVSGAGLISDVASLQVKMAKKEYTPISVHVTSEGDAYILDTWAKKEITFSLSGGLKDASLITGYEVTTTSGGKPTSSAVWEAVNGNAKHVEMKNIKDVTYWFRVVPVDTNASLSEPYKVKLDVDTPSVPTLSVKEKNSDPVSRFINAISFGNWLNKEIEVRMDASDTTSGIAYYLIEEDQNGTMIKSIDGKVSYGDEANLKIRAKACDQAGNCSAYSSEEQVMIDTQPPVITGVKDQSEYKQYYLPRFVSVRDKGSGVLSSNYITNGVTTAISDEAKVKGVGTYIVNAEDHAGNTISLTFKIVPLPSLDDIDGSDESKEIIDEIQKELDETRDKLDQTEIDDTQEWLDNANDKWENLRKKVVENEDKTSKVEGEGDTTFDPKVELIVEPIEEDTLPVLPRKAMYSYDVYLKKGSTIIQPNGSIKVYLPYPDDANPIIYEIDKDGNVREIAASKEGQFVVFTTNTLMKYAISNTKQEIIDDGNVSVPGPDGKDETDDDVSAKPNPDGDKPTKNPDGSVAVPPGGSVEYPGGSVIETPEGGTLNPDGSLTLPDGTEYDKDGNKKPKVCNIKDTYLNIDTDGDKRPDLNIDLDGDCVADINIDTSNDNIPDLDIDTKGDGKPDMNVDDNFDGKADRNLVLMKYWKPELNVDKPIAYDTMNNIPKEWLQGEHVDIEGSSADKKGSVGGVFSGSNTGDVSNLSLWWVIVLINGVIVIYQVRKYRKN